MKQATALKIVPAAPVTLHEKVVEVQLTCSFSWGNTTDNAISGEVNTAKHSGDALRVRKTLMPKDSGTRVKALQTALGDFYTWHKDNTMSTPTKGRRLLPVSSHFIYMEKFADARATAQSALNDLIDHYDDDVAAAKGLLQGAFKAEDYPPATEINRYFNCDVRFFPLPTGDRILGVLGKEVAADVDEYVKSMGKMAVDDAKSKLQKVVASMVERLSDPKAVFRDSLTSNMDELLDILPAMNVTDDAEFAAIIKDAQSTLKGWSPEHLRKNPKSRSQVANAAADILKKLGG